MNKARYRWLLRLAILPVAGLLLFLWLRSREGQQGLTIENQSGQPIAVLRITAGEQTRTFRDVANGSEVTAALDVGAGRLDVEGQFRDGTRIKGQFVQAEGGPDLGRVGLVVLPGGAITPRKERR
jgi:hypothetical protein